MLTFNVFNPVNAYEIPQYVTFSKLRNAIVSYTNNKIQEKKSILIMPTKYCAVCHSKIRDF